MKFLQDKLPGKVSYVVYDHDNFTRNDSMVKRSFELSNVSADASRCYIGYHYRFVNGAKIVETDGEIFLKQVRELVLVQMDQEIQLADAKAGHPEHTVKVDPPIFLVVVKSEKHTTRFNFYDEALSDRVSKALQHAVELCGGGNQEPF